MSTDPHSPDYLPPLGGTGGPYGSGTELGADLYALYYAGQLQIPTTAGYYSDAVTELHWISSTFAGIAGDLDHVVGDHILASMRELEDAMRLTTTRLYAAGEALVTIADRYAATDDAAAGEFRDLLTAAENAPMFDHPPGTHQPPGPDDPAGTPPDLPDDEDEIQDILDDAGIDDQLEEQDEEQDEEHDGDDDGEDED